MLRGQHHEGRAEGHQDTERVGDQRDAEGGYPKQPEIEQWIRQRALAAHEYDSKRQTGQDRQRRKRTHAVLG